MKKLSLTVFNIFKIAAMLLVKTAAMLLGLYTFFYLLFYIYFTLTVNLNFCVSQMSTVSDDVKIRIAVESLLKDYTNMLIYGSSVRADGALISTEKLEVVTTVPYKDVDDFLEKNPTCCSLYRITKTDRPFDVFDMVHMQYTVHYYDENNEVKRINRRSILRIDACGAF